MDKSANDPRRATVLLGCLAVTVLACGSAPPPAPFGLEPVRFDARLQEDEDISAVAFLNPGLAVASDEGDRVQFLDPGSDPATFRAGREPVALTEFGREVDIEGLDRSGRWLYVLGSHSIKRPKLDAGASRQENRRRLTTVEPEAFRHRIYRLPLDGKIPARPESIGLRPILERDPLLGPFTRIPARENGLNLEALGADDDTLYCGPRSPVLRGGWVPIVVFPFDRPADYELRFVQIGGRGIRGMTRVDGGWLLLAAYEEPREQDVEVFFWDGTDQTPGTDRSERPLPRLAYWPAPPGGKAEGITVLGQDDTGYDVLIVFDGIEGGAPRRGRVPRPEAAR